MALEKVDVEYRLRDSGVWEPYNARLCDVYLQAMREHYEKKLAFEIKMVNLLTPIKDVSDGP